MSDYAEFLTRKAQLGTRDGFDPIWMPDFLFDFQKYLVEKSLLRGKSAMFADCGLGKTPMQLVWAENVSRKENGRVLVITPLAVSHQTLQEGNKFGIECKRSIYGEKSGGITITNYERLHYFNPNDYIGAVCDESAILKSFDGVRRKEITEFMRKMKFRLLCTATPSPNEYIELGTSSEALGHLGYMDMLSRFFKNDQGNAIKTMRFNDKNQRIHAIDGVWRFKGHAELQFWRWVCSWAIAARKPSDLGFEDGPFVLPPLDERVHHVETAKVQDGWLFSLPAHGLTEQRQERRLSLDERCEKAASLVNHTGEAAAVWCALNDEGNTLERMIPDSVQVSGRDDDNEKEAKFLAFIEGRERVLITKEKIGAWGLNFQHCAHSVSFPTHSFEGYYQSVRRFLRFGQTRQVVSDIVTTEGEKSVLANLKRKAEAANHMFSYLVEHMNEANTIDRDARFTHSEIAPSWL